MSLYRNPNGTVVTTTHASIMCHAPACPALWQHEVEIETAVGVLDAKFCNHHLNKYEAGLLGAMGVDLELVGAPS